jgi:hypothetical protein
VPIATPAAVRPPSPAWADPHAVIPMPATIVSATKGCMIFVDMDFTSEVRVF